MPSGVQSKIVTQKKYRLPRQEAAPTLPPCNGNPYFNFNNDSGHVLLICNPDEQLQWVFDPSTGHLHVYDVDGSDRNVNMSYNGVTQHVEES